MINWAKENNKQVAILGLRMAEGGQRRNHTNCTAFNGDKLKTFKPLNPVTDEFMDWYIMKYDIKLCKLYYSPYNFKRTGCKGCPFAIGLQKELDTLEQLLPAEAKQCEEIWKPVYTEYRRIGYRLRKK